MTWLDYFKGRLAYDMFCLGVAVALVVVVFAWLMLVEVLQGRRRKRGAR